jgi:hypothetical protein
LFSRSVAVGEQRKAFLGGDVRPPLLVECFAMALSPEWGDTPVGKPKTARTFVTEVSIFRLYWREPS